MEFFIKKNATLPLLKLQVVKDGRSDYNNFMELLETSTIFFSMVNTENGIPKITSRPAGFVEKLFDDPNAEPEYYIYYQFTKQDTSIEGKYEGQFLVKTFEGNVILPVREKLFIYIQESFIADDLEYNTCYTSTFPCCGNPIIVDDPNENTITIVPQFYPSSIGALYTATSRYVADTDMTVSFKNILGVINGDPITINTSVTIYTGYKEGKTEIIIDDDFNRLNLSTLFSDVVLTSDSYSQYDLMPIIDSPIIIEPIGPRPRPKFLFATVVSCCDEKIYCMGKIPTTMPLGTTLVGNDGFCYILKEFQDICDVDLSFSGKYYKDCRTCTGINPCNVVKPTPTPTPTSTQNPCFITPTPTPTIKRDCVAPVLNTVLNTSGNTFLVYFTVTGPCSTIIVNWSSNNITWNTSDGECTSPRSITIPNPLPSTIFFNISQFSNECPPFTSNTITYYNVPVTPRPTTTPTLTPTPTGTALPPVAVIFVDCCDSSNVFMVYEVPSFGSDYTGTFYIESSGFNGCATVITPNVRPSLVYEYISLVKQTDCNTCFTNTLTTCSTPTPTPTNTTTPTPIVCDITYDTILITPNPTSTPTSTPTVTPTNTTTPTNTQTPTITLTNTQTPTITPTKTPTPTTTPTITPTKTSTPTPTVTNGAIVVPECSVIYLINSNVYSYNSTTNVSTLLNLGESPVLSGLMDVAHTTNKLWISNFNHIYEFNITLNPFSSTFNRTININLRSGLCAINDTTLISSILTNPTNVLNETIVKVTLNPNNTSTIENLFNLPLGRRVLDLIYTTNNKIIVTTTKINPSTFAIEYYISQYAFTNNVWVLELDLNITNTASNPDGLAIINGGIYIFSVNTLKKIKTTWPYTVTQVNNTGFIPKGVSQVPSCCNVTFVV